MRIAVVEGRLKLAWIGLINESTHQIDLTSKYGIDDGFIELVNKPYNGGTGGLTPAYSAISKGRYIVYNDIEKVDSQNEDMKYWRDEAMKLGFLSNIAYPLIAFNKTMGCLTLYSDEKGFFNEQEIQQLDELVNIISFAIEFNEEQKQRLKIQEEAETEKRKIKPDDNAASDNP